MVHRREFIKSIAASGVVAGMPSLVNGAKQKQPPNVLLILADDLGAQSLSSLGGRIPTPYLDQMGREGIIFQYAHAAPMCAPTRDELNTGKSRQRFDPRPGQEVPFLANELQQLGYSTAMAGKWMVGNRFDPPMRGYDEAFILVNGYRFWAPDFMVFGSQGMFQELNQPAINTRLNQWVVPLDENERHHATRLPEQYGDDVAVDFLCDFMERNQDGPFFAYYTSRLAHVPHSPTPLASKEEIELYKDAFMQTNDRNLKGLHEYIENESKKRGVETEGKDYRNDAIHYLDHLVNRLISKLDELGIRENTIIIFSSDNGNSLLDPVKEGVERIPGRKGDSRDGGTRVPLFVNWKNTIEAGRTCEDLVHVQDFLPTLLDLTGKANPQNRDYDGRSFAPQLMGREENPREWFIGSGAHPSIWLDKAREDFNDPDLESYDLVWIHGLRYKLYNDGRFYDLKNDLAEQHNIPPGEGSAEAEAIRKQFQTILDRYENYGD